MSPYGVTRPQLFKGPSLQTVMENALHQMCNFDLDKRCVNFHKNRLTEVSVAL